MGGYDLKLQENKAVFLSYAMEDLNANSIKEQLKFLDRLGLMPELCKLCSIVASNLIEVMCVLRRRNKVGEFICDKYKPKLTRY